MFGFPIVTVFELPVCFCLWTILPLRSLLHSNLVPIHIICTFIAAEVDSDESNEEIDADDFAKFFVAGVSELLSVQIRSMCYPVAKITSAELRDQKLHVELFLPRPLETELQVT